MQEKRRITRKKSKLELYGTRQVADILGIPEWRVKNFTEGNAYRLPPGVQAGKGRGTRRLYGWGDIFRIGLADRLVEFGFTPEVVGQAVREVPESLLTPYAAMLYGAEPVLTKKETPLLVRSGLIWRVQMADKVEPVWSQTVEHEGTTRGLFVINLANICDAIFAELQRFWTGMTRAEAEALAGLRASHEGD